MLSVHLAHQADGSNTKREFRDIFIIALSFTVFLTVKYVYLCVQGLEFSVAVSFCIDGSDIEVESFVNKAVLLVDFLIFPFISIILDLVTMNTLRRYIYPQIR